jgi:hypothetical protein
MGPPGPSSSQYGSRYSMSRTCGPRDIISVVIPRLGDNNVIDAIVRNLISALNSAIYLFN